MRKILLLAITFLSIFSAYSQCKELFISEYLEGSNNNKAIELYNPTPNKISLKDYSVGRFNNGSINYGYITFANTDEIAPYSTFTIVLDKRVLNGMGLEYPTWNGYQVYDTCKDATTGLPIIDAVTGKVVFCVKFAANATGSFEPVIGNIYRDTFDLTCRANKFVNPVYDAANLNTQAFYFNGNDAVALVKGTAIEPDGSNIIDVVGVIGEDPGTSWKDFRGFDLTKDRTLVRKKEFKQGTGKILAAQSDTFAYGQYLSLSNNSFTNLGKHICDCNPSTSQIGKGICTKVSTNDLLVDFKMYPNPASNYLNIIAPENIYNIEITNLIGQSLYSHRLSNANAYDIDLQNLQNGVYLVKIQFEGNKYGIQKLVVQGQ